MLLCALPQDEEWISDTAVANRYGTTRITIWRWDNNPNLGFPKAVKYRGKNYRRLRELQAFDEAQLQQARAA